MIYSTYYTVTFQDNSSALYSNFEYGLEKITPYEQHIVKDGETLFSIANFHYQDTKRWVLLAEFNLLEDPLSLVPGSILKIPEYVFS